MLGLQSKEPSFKQSLITATLPNSFLDRRMSEGPVMTQREDHSTPELMGDDDSETFIK